MIREVQYHPDDGRNEKARDESPEQHQFMLSPRRATPHPGKKIIALPWFVSFKPHHELCSLPPIPDASDRTPTANPKLIFGKTRPKLELAPGYSVSRFLASTN
jgi:hypothetical protein